MFQGALAGALVSLNLVAWISLGTQAAISTGAIHYPVKPVSVEGCSEALQRTAKNLTLIIEDAVKYAPTHNYDSRCSYCVSCVKIVWFLPTLV